MDLYPETVYIYIYIYLFIYVKSPIKGIAKFWLWRFLTEIGNINDQGCWWSFHPVGPIQQPLAITSIKQLSWIWFGIDCELFRLLDFSCCSQYLLVKLKFTCLLPQDHIVFGLSCFEPIQVMKDERLVTPGGRATEAALWFTKENMPDIISKLAVLLWLRFF
jgi:hypothetical protein